MTLNQVDWKSPHLMTPSSQLQNAFTHPQLTDTELTCKNFILITGYVFSPVMYNSVEKGSVNLRHSPYINRQIVNDSTL